MTPRLDDASPVWARDLSAQARRFFALFGGRSQADRGRRDDDDDDLPGTSADDDDSDADDAAADLGDLSLQPQQRQQIAQLRADTQRQVEAAKRALDQASANLERQIANPSASDAEISRAIDAVTQSEAAIRKARILSWHHARAILDDTQRSKVEGAAARARHR